MARRSAWCVLMLVVAGCAELDTAPTRPCTRTEVGSRIALPMTRSLDLLLVVGSETLGAELGDALPGLVETLLGEGLSGDVSHGFEPYESLQIGVVTADLGVGPVHGIDTCGPGLGADALLRRCSPDGPAVFGFARGDGERGAQLDLLRCATRVGPRCVYSQPLEAALKALSPAWPEPWTSSEYVPPRFMDESGIPDLLPGHGDGANAAFLRLNTDLAIVVLADDDDCSTQDASLFSADDPRFASAVPEVRCSMAGSAGVLEPVRRYVEGLRGRRRFVGDLVFAVVGGIPTDLEPAAGEPPDFDRILADPRMSPAVDGMTGELRASCSAARGAARPPRRLVETARDLAADGALVSVVSSCRDDLGAALDGVAARIARGREWPACAWANLSPAESGLVPCDVLELLPESGLFSTCASLPGRELVEVVTNEWEGPRELCRLAQLDHERAMISEAPGWYLDPDPPVCAPFGAIRSTPSGRSPPGAERRLECQRTIVADTGLDRFCDEGNGPRWTPCTLGMFCVPQPATDRCVTGTTLPDREGIVLACDPVDEVCAAPCTTDADCVEGGLPGFVCDRRTNAEAAGPFRASELPEALRASPRDLCVHPTCR